MSAAATAAAAAAARHGRLAACNDHGSSTGAHGALWNSSSRWSSLLINFVLLNKFYISRESRDT